MLRYQGHLMTVLVKFSTPSFVTDANGKPIMMYKEYTIIKD